MTDEKSNIIKASLEENFYILLALFFLSQCGVISFQDHRWYWSFLSQSLTARSLGIEKNYKSKTINSLAERSYRDSGRTTKHL